MVGNVEQIGDMNTYQRSGLAQFPSWDLGIYHELYPSTCLKFVMTSPELIIHVLEYP